jgi:hypothetical protein
MKQLSKPHPNQPAFRWDEDSPALRAKLRMVELPTDASRPLDEQALFPCSDLWVPVAVVNGNVHILPGVPRLCRFFPPYFVPLSRTHTCWFVNADHGVIYVRGCS